ncbi:putative POM121-like protein 1 [Plecturocebus cupreus]
MDAQQETHKSQDSLGRVSLLASAAGDASLPAVSGRKRRSAEPLPEQDKHPRVEDNPEGEERGPEGTRDSWSEFRPLLDNGDPLPLVPRPEPPMRGLHAQRSQPCRMRPCTKEMRSLLTGGFPWLKRRRGPDSSHCHVTLMSEDNSQAVSQAIIHTQDERAADATPGEKLAPRNGSPTSQASRPHKRKFPPLPRRREGPLMLPPPLKLGFRVTAEDLDLEKEAALRSIGSALQGEAKAIWDYRASRPSQALSLPATGTSPPAVPKAPSMECTAGDTQVPRLPGPNGPPSICCRGPLSSCCVWEEMPLGRSPALLRSPPCHLFTLPGHSPGHLADSCRLPSSKCGLQPEKPTAWRFCCCSYHRALTPSTRNPMSGSPPMEGKEAPHIPEPQPQLQQIAVSGFGSSSAASTSANLAPKAATSLSGASGWLQCKLPPISSGPSDAPQAQHSLRKGHHQPGRTEGLWSHPSTETSSTQPKPVVLHGPQQGTRTLKRSLLSSDLAAPAAAPASSAPRQPAQGTTAHSAAGVSSPTTCTSGPPTRSKSAWAAGSAGSLPEASAASACEVRAASSHGASTKTRQLC